MASPLSKTGPACATVAPRVVLDLSWLQAHSTPTLPQDCEYIIPDVVVKEIGGKREPQRSIQAGKLFDVLEANRGRFSIGRFWNELSTLERNRGYAAAPAEIVQPDVTNLVQTFTSSRHEFVSMAAQYAAKSEGHERLRAEFVEHCVAFADWLNGECPDDLRRMSGDPSAQRDWIRKPTQVVEYVIENNPGYDTPAWRDRLSVFPDEYAVGRFARILIWYAMRYACDRPTSFENDWDDAHYAFVASYTSLIATLDKGLRRMCSDVFPDVQTWEGV